ncbi:hypothetical protein A3J19_04835 [Candidatus Daviesbacteria bacterium RIFCSPLOWO2_02_FULL_41_8]|uniref:Type II secretion system protein GspG C-terminal domain-containing protein n=3 Tax=Candidatus Daviesiibacteriota TaxID=1752718 RepID=A0A1F5NH53_9BACT|nr:MAG: hypothetical protein A2871_02570 [Candidatus Daviesbacteria bacterium RIFCSPHIGHO2_01_FULL_41_23]OGE33794.1 MAG: hypothetical protein A3D83_04445 [Candidatus Daviesbacteria bacterium RIFCSPHIGHO2_02_FULL_41_10]OGE62061.1 MAG: hypothetical protein A2967_00185 [Candidatus Daviesbacteria bacterium RIFCSPLOWO2_01_FULL_41_32]OGE77026.1 MAG: hypothetical protein A3J19_04835 [Candidatus Daviesbacteria bacterium RIFCSPLOWO2_02_FULL_41_8]
MGLLSIIIGGLIIAFSSFYLINNLALDNMNNRNPSGTNQAPVDNAKDAQIIADFQAIQTSLNLYKAQKGQYPDNLKQLIDENFAQGSFKNPYTQEDYSYELSSNSYKLSTNLGTGKPYQVSN